MFKEGNIVKVINPNYSTYGMIGTVQRNYKVTEFTTSIVNYGRTDYIQLKPQTGYKEGDDIYVSFGKPVIGVLNTGIFAKEDLKILYENGFERDYYLRREVKELEE
jgi:hypothetical protein